VYHSTLDLRVTKKKKKKDLVSLVAEAEDGPVRAPEHHLRSRFLMSEVPLYIHERESRTCFSACYLL